MTGTSGPVGRSCADESSLHEGPDSAPLRAHSMHHNGSAWDFALIGVLEGLVDPVEGVGRGG
jgi:hypothetical protein